MSPLDEHKEACLIEAEDALKGKHWLAEVILEWVRLNGGITEQDLNEYVEMDYLGIHDWSEYKKDHRRTV